MAIHTTKGFSVVNEADVLLEFSCFFYDPNMLKYDAVKVLHSVCQKIWKTQQWPQDWKKSVFIPIPRKDNAKECSNYRTVALISHASKVMLNNLQARLQQYVNRELLDVQAGFRKGKGIRAHVFCQNALSPGLAVGLSGTAPLPGESLGRGVCSPSGSWVWF